ncbi:Thioredoxin-2 [Nymphon striatum]|nr:Thioredoxin-2 [Nymphon striatum]
MVEASIDSSDEDIFQNYAGKNGIKPYRFEPKRRRLNVDQHGNDDLKNQLEKAADNLVVIDFYATWCGPCKIIGPKFAAMHEQFPTAIFLKVDVDQFEDVAEAHDIDVMPTFVFLKSGKKGHSMSSQAVVRAPPSQILFQLHTYFDQPF